MRKNKAQTTLETVIIFVVLAVLIVGTTKIFTEFFVSPAGSTTKSGMLDRLNIFKRSRFNAVNSIVQGVGPGMTPLDYALFNTNYDFNVPINIPGVTWDSDQLYEPRILVAQEHLRFLDNTINLILPYKANQMQVINNSWREDDSNHSISEIQRLSVDMIQYIDDAFGRIYNPQVGEPSSTNGGAWALFKATYDFPTYEGPYYQTPCSPDPYTCNEGYTWDCRLPVYRSNPGICAGKAGVCDNDDTDDCAKKFRDTYRMAQSMLQASVNNNRSMLQQAYKSLGGEDGTGGAYPGLYSLFYDMANNLDGPTEKGLKGRLKFIRDHISLPNYSWPIYIAYHTQCTNVINQIADYLGTITPCILSDELAEQSLTVHEKLNLSLPGHIQTKQEAVGVYNMVNAWDDIIFPNLGGGAGVEYVRSMKSQLLNDLDMVIDSWLDNTIRNFYIDLSLFDNLAIYEITAINRWRQEY